MARDPRHGAGRLQPHEERGIPDGLLVGVLGFLIGLTLLVWTATGLAGLFAHGSWPDGVTFTNTPLAIRGLVSEPHDLAAAWPATPPAQLSGYGLFWGLLIGQLMTLVVLTVFVLGTLARWRAVRSRGQAVGETDRAGPAGAVPATVADRPGSRPTTAVPEDTPAAAGTVAGAGTTPTTLRGEGAPSAQAAHASVPVEHGAATAPPEPSVPAVLPPPEPAGVPDPRRPYVLYGGPSVRRPSAVQAIRDAAGPALVVTSDPTVWSETKDARAKLGPALVYDPGHLCDTPARLHWSPTTGCEDPATAASRAAALFAPVRPRSRLDEAVADTAETLLRCWLHAAAVDGRPFKQVHRWAQGSGAHEPVRILRTHQKAASGLAGLLESALTSHRERREIAQELTARTLSALSSVHIREACTPNRTDSLTLESFVVEGGTLYVVGESIEDPRTRPGAMPLLTALASSVVEHGRRMAARSSDGRLDPPLALVLDDVAAVAPLPLLPELLATGPVLGMPTLALLRSREQGRARWPQPLTAPDAGHSPNAHQRG
ncbi:type VI secretion protein [Streptomyces sp. WMMC940]|uniref:type VI secretion protein n=1 Tax=Streptomyces sp. WMMC940 TaxID=3015153 RepID=UPI0022B67EC9|nr:type VI secretion protein [Streptomyces sp. WMMC940]MCZ7459422.1 type VI secretion protein [Streptomyces sp. WMMC940]